MAEWKNGIAKLTMPTPFPVGGVHAGHGEDFGNIHPLIEKRLARQHERAIQVKKMLKNRPLTV